LFLLYNIVSKQIGIIVLAIYSTRITNVF
jgi:hypothetical protein